MTEADQFALLDARDGNTMIAFAEKSMAMRYALHRHTQHGQIGLMAGCEDTRERTGLFVMWRDRVPGDKLFERLENCRWLLEEILAGRQPWPEPGTVTDLGKVGGAA
jgi:hypothetical protein